MTSSHADFIAEVRTIIEPLLSEYGFQFDGAEDDVYEGGPTGAAVYYRGPDCKFQVWYSEREHASVAMIATDDAPNEHGLYNRSGKWRDIAEFSPTPSIEELLAEPELHFSSYREELEWLRGWIEKYFPSAHAGILGISGPTN